MLKPTAKNVLVAAWVAAAEIGATPLQGVASQTGHIHALTIFAHFADERSLGSEIPSFATRIFAEQPGSLTHFYREMSRGQFTLTGEVLPRWYVARSNADAYAGEESGYGRFAREVIEAVDADVDLGRYDNDGPDGVPNSGDDDGYVDFIFLVSASAPTGFITEEATGVAQLGLANDFVSKDRAQRGGFIQVRSDNVLFSAGGLLPRPWAAWHTSLGTFWAYWTCMTATLGPSRTTTRAALAIGG